MATFTMELRVVLEREDGDIGLGDYPIFDEKYRETLNQKIIDHYWNREIGAESIELFRLFLKRKMNEIMPFYNQFYKSQQIKLDPMQTINLKNMTVADVNTLASNTGESETASSSDAKSRATAQETPHMRLAGDGDYATGIQDNVSVTNANGEAKEKSSAESNEKAETLNTVTGFQGHSVELLMAFRESFLNIDIQIITELETLFMLVWGNGDEYTREEMPYGYVRGYGFGFGFRGLI